MNHCVWCNQYHESHDVALCCECETRFYDWIQSTPPVRMSRNTPIGLILEVAGMFASVQDKDETCSTGDDDELNAYCIDCRKEIYKNVLLEITRHYENMPEEEFQVDVKAAIRLSWLRRRSNHS